MSNQPNHGRGDSIQNSDPLRRNEHASTGTSSKIPTWLLCLGLVVPTLITYVYFDLLSTAAPSSQKTAYALGKGLQVAVLLIALGLIRKQSTIPIQVPQGPKKYLGTMVGLLSGILIGAAIGAVTTFVLIPMGIMDGVKETAKAKIAGMGIDSPLALIGLGLFYSLIHSGFEELYWRAFVYRALLDRVSTPIAVVVSSLGFMAHHVIVLAKYFSYSNPVTYLASFGVAIGGAVWAIMYSRYQSLIPGWISHALVDAAIFGVGYFLLFG